MSTTQITETAWMNAPPARPTNLDMPQWYTDFQKASWDRFCELPVPTRNDENWRYADLKKSRFEKLNTVPPSEVQCTVQCTKECPIRASLVAKAAARFRFIRGELEESHTNGLPDGVICLPINEAIAELGDRLKPYFDIDAKRLGDEKFAALNGAASIYGLCIIVPRGIELNETIFVEHFIAGETTPVFPRTLVIAESNAKVSVVETFDSADDDTAGLSIGICDLHAENGGKIRHTLMQNLNQSSKQVHLSTSNAAKDASIQTVLLNLGGAWIRNESINRMTATGANTEIHGANLTNNLQEVDQRTLQIHDAQHTTSDLLIKNALYDKSRIIFGGLIQVLPGAHHTDSYQSCRNLLGSDEAEINAMPGLEIDADQVRCSHGATSGQIRKDEIFYLQTRGITEEDARRIVSCGFLGEAFEKVTDEEVKHWLGELIEVKFDRV